jgi:hypothetical protein
VYKEREMIKRLTFGHDLIMFEGEIWNGTATKSLISTFRSVLFQISVSLSLCMFTFCFPSESDYDDDRESCGIFPFLPRVNVREESCLSVFKEVIEILLLLSDFHFHQ